MSVNEGPSQKQRRSKKLRFIRDIAIGAVAVPVALVVIAGLVAYFMYLFF